MDTFAPTEINSLLGESLFRCHKDHLWCASKCSTPFALCQLRAVCPDTEIFGQWLIDLKSRKSKIFIKKVCHNYFPMAWKVHLSCSIWSMRYAIFLPLTPDALRFTLMLNDLPSCCFFDIVGPLYPVRNDAPLLSPSQASPQRGFCPGGRLSKPEALLASRFDSKPRGPLSEPGSAPEGLMPRRAGFIPLRDKSLTGFNTPLGRFRLVPSFESRYSGTGISNGVYWRD